MQVTEGQAIPPFVIEGIGRPDFVRYAGASGDFNPIHFDDDFARGAGNPSVFGHGMLTAGLLATCVSRFVGAESIRSYRVRFATRVWPGDTITCAGTVTKVYRENGEARIDGELTATNQKGESVVSGTFTAALPD
jgi:acyl dehydratase